jgi:drug/metabolite transporter (DMT)-like permease
LENLAQEQAELREPKFLQVHASRAMSSLQALTHWTAQGSFLFYVIAFLVRPRAARMLWTVACLLMFVHVGLAFHSFHHWSHDAAYEDTARQTAELTGLQWGGGIFANYALLVIWLVDVVWWWRGASADASRAKTATVCIQGFLAFMWFNATVVFGHGWTRWLGVAGFLILIGVWLNSRAAQQNKTAST